MEQLGLDVTVWSLTPRWEPFATERVAGSEHASWRPVGLS